MQALLTVAFIFAILAKCAMILLSVMGMLKRKHQQLGYLILLAALGILLLGDIMFLIGGRAIIVGCIFMILGWPGFAAGLILLNLDLVKQLPIAADIVAPPERAQPAAPQQPQQPQQ